jgi:hypothetical protein
LVWAVCLVQIIEDFGFTFITNAVGDAGKVFIQDIAVLLTDLHATPTTNNGKLHRQSPLPNKKAPHAGPEAQHKELFLRLMVLYAIQELLLLCQ